MAENKKDEIVKSMKVLNEVSSLLSKAEEILNKNVDKMEPSIVAIAGITIHGFVISADRILDRRLEKDELYNQVKAKHIADAENSGLSMN